MTELIKAVLNVMKEVKSIEKNLNVGSGNYGYKGVADKDVKLQIGQAMQKNGLIILPVMIDPKTTITEWEEDGQYGKKHKSQVFTEVMATYRLMHTSGEGMDIVGYGHGADSQDKSAGKATTYALKYALLNTFLVPTGDIDDTDATHSDSLPKPPVYANKAYSNTATDSQRKFITDLMRDKAVEIETVQEQFKLKPGEKMTFDQASEAITWLKEL